MRLFYCWFCRVIGVGSLLDMVKLYVMMLIWILSVFIIFRPEEVEGKQHRSSHRHGHPRHRHHHRKRVKLRHQLPQHANLTVETNKSSLFSPKDFNVANVVNATTPWILNQTTTTLFFNSRFADKEESRTLYRSINGEDNRTLAPIYNETSSGPSDSSSAKNSALKNNFGSNVLIFNYQPTKTDSNDLFSDNLTNSSTMDFRNNTVHSLFTMRVIEESTTSIFPRSFVKYSKRHKVEEIESDDSIGSNDKIQQEQVVEDLEKLFGSPKSHIHSENIALGTPVVTLIRKKRSLVPDEEEDDAVEEKKRIKENLLDFTGPSILNDPEEIADRQSSDTVHKRVKRDDPELDDDRSALSSLDSTYLRNLEDSFAPSALELQARRSEESSRVQREAHRNSPDLPVSLARSKRDTKLSAQGEKTKDDQIDSPESSPADSVSVDDAYIWSNRVNKIHYPADSQSSMDSGQQEDNNYESVEDTRWSISADSTNSIDPILREKVNSIEDQADASSTVDADTKIFASDSRTLTRAGSSGQIIDSILHSRADDVNDSTDSPSSVYLDEENKANYFQPGSQPSTPASYTLTNTIDSISRVRINVVEDPEENPYKLDVDSTNLDFSAELSTSVPAHSFVSNKANSVSEIGVNDDDHPADNLSTVVSYHEGYNNDSAIGSSTSPAQSFLRDVSVTVLENKVNDVEANTNNSSQHTNETRTSEDYVVNKEQSSVKAIHPRRSPSDNSILKDDNSIKRYGLDDVYPEIIQDPENPSPMVQLVRTKRFRDRIVYPEAPDVSYANKLDNGRTVDEPYAEDNRIIDSMLSKVDYRSVGERDRHEREESERPFNEEKIDADEAREEAAIRGKRGTSSKRMRKKTRGGCRGYGKQKKCHRGESKKHRSKRIKMKRSPKNLFKREFDNQNYLSDTKRDEEAISPRDKKFQRECEERDNENFYSNANEVARRLRRDIQRSPDTDFVSSNAEDLMEEKIDAKSGNKRNSAPQVLKYSKNAREVNVEQNPSKEITDRPYLKFEAAGPIRDIKQLVVELLAKVNQLHGYTAGSNVDEEQSKNSRVSDTSNVDGTSEEPSKILQQTPNSRSPDSSIPRPAAAIRPPEACWKHSKSGNRESQTSKIRPVRNLRCDRCGKRLRRKRKSHRKWDRWTDWSSCSVTCGRGRQIRWRHCVRNCSTAETEMEEKACQLPACAPGKFLGIFG